MRTALLVIASLVIAYSLPAIGASSTRRVLLLHGTGSTASSFIHSPTKRGAKSFLAGVPMEGLWNSNAAWNSRGVPPAAWNWHVSAIDAQGPEGDWWADDGTYRGSEDSIARVEAEIEERKVTGVVGFE